MQRKLKRTSSSARYAPRTADEVWRGIARLGPGERRKFHDELAAWAAPVVLDAMRPWLEAAAKRAIMTALRIFAAGARKRKRPRQDEYRFFTVLHDFGLSYADCADLKNYLYPERHRSNRDPEQDRQAMRKGIERWKQEHGASGAPLELQPGTYQIRMLLPDEISDRLKATLG